MEKNGTVNGKKFNNMKDLNHYLNEQVMSKETKSFLKGFTKIKLDKKFSSAWMPGVDFLYKDNDRYYFVDEEGDYLELKNEETLKQLKKSGY
jgi:hypothetical protein